MDRRTFIKGAFAATAVIASGSARASDNGSGDEKTIHRLTNRSDPSLLEQKHVPSINVPEVIEKDTWFDVKIKVGYLQEHPSNPDHWITWIKLLANGKEIAKTEFPTGGVGAPQAVFRIRLASSSTLEAMEHCNIHGTWISDKVEVRV
jgi:superoxide reductase